MAFVFYALFSSALSITEYLSLTTQDFILGVPGLTFSMTMQNNFTLNYNDLLSENPSFKMVKKRLNSLKVESEDFVTLDRDGEFIQSKFLGTVNDIKYYEILCKSKTSDDVFVTKDLLMYKKMMELIYKVNKNDMSFVKDTTWVKVPLSK